MDTLTYGSDSELRWWRQDCGTWRYLEFATDRSGNRLAAVDTTGARIPQSLMSYTARGQLFFAMTPTASVSNYDYNWHWYDGNGLRVLTHRQLGSGWVPGTDYQDNGNRTYYVYDGADVALTIGCGVSSCQVTQRVMSGGVDQPLAGWFKGATGARNLMFVTDAQGSTRAALRADGLRETDATLWARDPFGAPQGASGTGGAYNTETGFAGASTPNSTGGFTYLRNRWYDPATGRFLTQDPIGLAGGVNLYAYAGNNPVSYSDPFGLCPPKLTGRPCGSPLYSPMGTPMSHGTIRSDRHGDGAFESSRGSRGAHRALDINAPVGTHVSAMDEGRVIRWCTGANCGIGGQSVTLGHYDTRGRLVSTSYYAHLSQVDPSVMHEGAAVVAGTRLGASGLTGNATGTDPHLHVSVSAVGTGTRTRLEKHLNVTRPD